MDDGLYVHVVVDPVVGQAVVADLAAADIHVEVLADALVADVRAGRVVRDRVLAIQVGDVLPHPFVDVVAVLALQAPDRAHVLGRDDLRLERVEALGERAVFLAAGERRDERAECEQADTHIRRDSMSHGFPLQLFPVSLPDRPRRQKGA